MATDEISLKVKTMLQMYDVTVSANAMVEDIMNIIAEIAEVSPARQKLIKMKNNRPSQPMEPAKSIHDYGLQDGDKVFLIIMAAGFEQTLSERTQFGRVWQSYNRESIGSWDSKPDPCDLYVEFQDHQPIYFRREYPSGCRYRIDWHTAIVGFTRGIPPTNGTPSDERWADPAHAFTLEVWRDSSTVKLGFFHEDPKVIEDWARCFEGLSSQTGNLEEKSTAAPSNTGSGQGYN